MGLVDPKFTVDELHDLFLFITYLFISTKWGWGEGMCTCLSACSTWTASIHASFSACQFYCAMHMNTFVHTHTQTSQKALRTDKTV